jgi:hypothetical protein
MVASVVENEETKDEATMNALSNGSAILGDVAALLLGEQFHGSNLCRCGCRLFDYYCLCKCKQDDNDDGINQQQREEKEQRRSSELEQWSLTDFVNESTVEPVSFHCLVFNRY